MNGRFSLRKRLRGVLHALRLRGPLAGDPMARMLHAFVLSVAVWLGVWAIILVPLYPSPPARQVGTVVQLMIPLGSMVLLRLGSLHSASAFYLAAEWMFVTFLLAFNDGIRSPFLAHYVALPIMASWLLGLRGALWTVALCMTSTLAFALIEMAGIGMPRPFVTPLGIWATLVQIALTGAIPVAQILKARNKALERVQNDSIELQQRESSLRESEARFRNMADTVPVMIWVSGPDKLWTFFNKVWLDFTGRTIEQELGKGWATSVHPDDHEHFFATYYASFDASRSFQMEYRLRRADDEYRWVLCTGVPREGIFVGYIGSCIDITDQKRAEETLRRSLQEIAHLNRVAAMGELTASIAHELNQPLAAILCNAQAAARFLSGASPDLAQVLECLSDIVADDKRAAEVIQRLRDLLKKGEHHASSVDLNEVVSDAIRLVRNDALLRQVSVEFEPLPGLPPVFGDRIQLHQVVLNLIANGLDATAEQPQGDRWMSVRTAKADGGSIELTVEDSGKGIANSDMARVFEPFFTTKREGLGMGLSISRSIVQAHRGQIWAENSAGRGAIFHCVLPVAQQGAVASAK